jgi:hypothetical protein
MTGENFIRLNRHDEHLERMIKDLDTLRAEWGEEYRRQDEYGYYIFDSNKLDKIQERIEKLKFRIYMYVYNRNPIEYTREFEKKHLW